MKRTAWAWVYVLVFASLFGSGAAWGQTNGEIRGTVNDPSGAVVPNATVTAILTGTDSTRTVTSDKDGAFVIPELAVGSYSVSTEAQGFKKVVTTDVVVTIGHVNFITITLQVGGSADTVTVEANAAQVETSSTQLGAVMTDTAIVQLPMNTRNAYSLLQLQPGVQSQLGNDLFFGSDNAGAVSVNGGRGRANNYMVNGGDGNDIFVNAPAIQPSPDAIEEFRVLTNTFDAEYGRNSGSVVNVVTKSGTNALHGDFYEFIRNNALNTRGYFDPFLLDYKQNQFGATLGAPIKKDKTFIFGSYEGNRLVQGISSGTVVLPSLAEVGGDFSNGLLPSDPTYTPFTGGTDANFASVLNGRPGCTMAINNAGGVTPAAGALYSNIFPGNKIPTSCFDPTAAGVYKQYVSPFQSQADASGNLISSGNRRLRTDQFTVRLDHSITPSQKFTAYYYFEDDNRTDPFSNFQAAGANLPGFDALFKSRDQQWNLSHTWTIGSNAVNEFRFNYFRESQESQNHPLHTFASVQDSCIDIAPANCFTDPGNPAVGITTDLPGRVGLPFINVSGGFAIGNNFEGELPQTGNTFQWMDNYTRTMGKHTLKFGGDVRRQRFDQFLYFEVSGNYSFINQANGDQIAGNDAYPNYFLGAADSYQQGSAQGENVRNTALYLFAQDSYKVSNSVTVNYGLRWELNTPYYDRGNRIQTFRPGQATTQYPCFLSGANASALGLTDGDCGQATTNGNNAVFPLGLVFPGDKGVPRGLTTTYYKAFAPRIGIAWSPGATDGLLAKITGGPGKLSVRAGFGIFYNPIEQLVLEQFSAEPPFGGSTFLSQTLFNTPFAFQSGSSPAPNPFMGVINQTPQTPCAVQASTTGPPGCVDWSTFRPLLLFGEFQPHLKSQYSEQYNLTIERQLTKDMLFRISYVGTQAHHLLASRDLNAGNAQTCAEIGQIAANDPTGQVSGCGPVGADAQYVIPTHYSDGSDVIVPTYNPPVQPFKVPAPTCTGLPLPYNAGSSVNCIPGGTDLATSPLTPNGINLVGTRPFSSPNCQPLSAGGVGCPADGVPVFSNIFAEDTIANSNYNALQISVEKNYTHGLLFQASYTFSKAIDQGASFEQQLNPLNFNATRGLSLLSAKNRFVFSPVWELPIPKQEGVAGKFANGWQLSAIITYQSGFPIRIEDQNDGELQSSFFFEDANTPSVDGKIQFVNPKKNAGIYFNSNNFTDPTSLVNPTPLGQFGNVPHSLCCGPAISNTDFVVTKKTAINERWNTEFRAEFYNLFNHTEFSNPDGNFTDGPAGSVAEPLGGTFGQILNTRGGPRVLQFGLKFLF